MVSRTSGILRSYGPSLAGAAVLVPFIAYYVGQVNQQRQFQNDQAFRALAALTRDLDAKLDAYHKTLLAADAVADEMPLRGKVGAKSPAAEVEAYLHRYLPEADSVEFKQHPETGPLVFEKQLTGTAGQERIQFGLYHQSTNGKDDKPHMVATVPLPELTDIPAAGHGRRLFDLVLLADAEGKVLSSTGSVQLHLEALDGLIGNRPKEEPGAGSFLAELLPGSSKAAARQSAAPSQWKDYARAGGRALVTAFGDSFELFLAPTTIVLERRKKDGSTEPVRLVLAGMVRRSTFEAAATSLPAVNLVTPFIALAVLLAFLWPVVKLHTMSPKERLTRRSVAWMGAGAAVAALPLSLLFLEAGYSITMRSGTDQDLRKIGRDISAHFHEEVARCLWVLRWHLSFVQKEVPRAGFNGRLMTTYATRERKPTEEDLSGYPFFQHLILADYDPKSTDAKVRQTVKYSMDRVPTPMIDVSPSQYAALARLLRGTPAKLRMEEKAEELPFAIHPFVSPNTGEQLTMLAARWADIAPQRTVPDRRVALLTSPMLSLVDPVVPDGFGFAVVNRTGQVLYHSDSSRNLRENFFEECSEPNRIRSLVEGHASFTLNLNYRGEGVRIHVQQLAQLPKPISVAKVGRVQQLDGVDWSLIVFRRTEPVKALFMEAGVLFLLGGALIFSVIGLALTANRCLRQAVPTAKRSEQRRRLWPRESALQLYRREIIIFGAGLMMIYALTGPWMPVVWPLHLPLGLLAVIALVCGSAVASARYPRWIGRRLDRVAKVVLGNRMSLAVTFSLRGVVMLGFLVIGFGMALFQCCLTLAQHNQEKAMHWRLLQRLEDRQARAQDLAQKTGWPDLAKFRVASPLDIYDPRASASSWHRIVTPLNSLCSSLVRPFSVELLRNVGEVSGGGAIRTPSIEGSALQSWESFDHWPSAAPGRQLSPWPVLPWMRPQLFPDSLLLLGVGLLLGTAVFSWVLGVVQQLFLVDRFNPDPLRWRRPAEVRTELAQKPAYANGLARRELILSPPRSGTSKLIRSAYQGCGDNTAVLDLAVEFDVDPDRLAERRDRLVRRHRHSEIVVLDNFEWRFNEASVRAEVLRLLEGLVYSKGPSLHVFSSVDPVLYVEELASDGTAEQAESVRWTRVLGGFRKVLFDTPHQLRDSWQQVKLVLEGSGFSPAQIGECGEMFRREFGCAPLLRKLAKDAALRVAESPGRFRTPAQFERFVLDQARDLADEYFRMLWSLTTPTERLVLYQLAVDGWMNPLNETAISHLVRKRLIVNGGGRHAYELFSEAFRQFVKQNQDRREAAVWSAEERESSWHSLRVGLITLLVLFLIWLGYVRQDLFDRYVGYVVTMAGGSAALLRVVMQWFSRKEKAA